MHSTILNSFGYNLKIARKRKKLTQSELADRCGISRSTLIRYEKGKCQPSLDNVENFSKELCVDYNYLFERKE
jgi:transcriptional regulator with XRE-family HTH domain